MSVKSTYNFVPAPTEQEVYKPEWADKVSHDIPFSDGESGEIELKITAQTPIFIRNGHSKADKEIFDNFKAGKLTNPSKDENAAIERYLEFSNIEINGRKEYFIPASSLKGMFRNVLEIMSFSRMNQINNHTHAVRQTVKTKDTIIEEGYELGNDKKKILAGFLIEKDHKYYIYSCGEPLKIRYTDIDQKLKTDFEQQFGMSNTSNSNKDFSSRTGAYKYEKIIKTKQLEHQFEAHPLDGEKESSWVSAFQPLKYVRFPQENNNLFWGRIVCVGQASIYNISTARRGEYVFKGKMDEVLSDNKNRFEVDEDTTMKTFLFVNKNGKGKNEELADWTYWKDKLDTGIPVFFRLEENKNDKDSKLSKEKKKVKDFGLTFMYKQPVKYSTISAAPQYDDKDSEDYELDLAATIFGQSNKENSHKGRVFISAFVAEGKVNVLEKRSYLLGTPRSSFVPFYLQQSGKNGKLSSFETYNTNPILRGFKRYPVHQAVGIQNTSELSQDMLSHFQPLDKDVIFCGKIRFHNLRKIEIGALLSSITFHGSSNTLHSIGLAKPFGYGSIKVEVNALGGMNHDIQEYLKTFEKEMRLNSDEWLTSLKEVLSIGTVQDADFDKNLEYEDLKMFQEIKNKGFYLQKQSEIIPTKPKVNLCLSVEDITKAKQEKESADIENDREFHALLAEANKFLENCEFEKASEKYKKALEKTKDKSGFDFKKRIELRKTEKEELDTYHQVKSENTVAACDEFITKYPTSTYRLDIDKLRSTLKNNSGLPVRLSGLKKFDQFSKESEDWIKKLENKTIIGSGFEEEHIAHIIRIAKIEKNDKKLVKDWLPSGRNEKKIAAWYGDQRASEIVKKN